MKTCDNKKGWYCKFFNCKCDGPKHYCPEKPGVKHRKVKSPDHGNDEFALLGHEFATSGGYGALPEFQEEIDLLMFNAGIVQVDNRTPKIVSIDERWIEQRSRTSDKELGIICNH